MARSSKQPPEGERPTVLIVDDDCDVRDGLKELLLDAGYRPVCARHGDDALAYLRRNPAPAAILLDLFMPIMNGWEFVRRVKATTLGSIPIIAITGAEPYWGAPVPEVLRKPLEVDALLGALRQAQSGFVAARA